jgi:hypothetical protein
VCALSASSVAMSQCYYCMTNTLSQSLLLSSTANFKDTTAGANGKKALPFRVTSIKEAVREGSSGSGKGADSSASVGGGCELQLVVNPGFDVSEWIQVRVQRFLKLFMQLCSKLLQHCCVYMKLH